MQAVRSSDTEHEATAELDEGDEDEDVGEVFEQPAYAPDAVTSAGDGTESVSVVIDINAVEGKLQPHE